LVLDFFAGETGILLLSRGQSSLMLQLWSFHP
jgi:hypothetical protein